MKYTLHSQINFFSLISFSGLPGRYRIPESTWFLSVAAAIKSSSASLPFSAPGPLLYPLWPPTSAGLVRVTPGELQEVDDAEEFWIQESGIGWVRIFRKEGEKKPIRWSHLCSIGCTRICTLIPSEVGPEAWSTGPSQCSPCWVRLSLLLSIL